MDSEGKEPGERRFGVAFSLVTFLLATQEKVTRSPEASEKRHGCRATKERREVKQSHWDPAYVGAPSNEKRVRNGRDAARRRSVIINKNFPHADYKRVFLGQNCDQEIGLNSEANA